ncbi:unnamed protein product [Ambrosiozyma monospora]|uniref:Unnamed protein product n=1 Tax=Ambrosiozyma monospora TaxID=43982 RepID=A0ACB5T8I8_AMBMO|nr:unnamed protein product [Ambrosiozyma monospora]
MTGYTEPHDKSEQIAIANSAERMTVEKWMARFIVLESVAGIPGSVAGCLRHLRSLRRFRRDMAWIETLHDEAYNEKMHLLTFLKIAKPTLLTRVSIYALQIVFAFCFTLVYFLYPNICHRFVGYLEEEAVKTYTRCIDDMELGLTPDLSNLQVPQIAIDYWNLPIDANFYVLIQYIRADEAKHREVNHTFANLETRGNDRNPFALHIEAANVPQPSKTLENHRGVGWEREDLIL